MDKKISLRIIITLFFIPYMFLHLGCSLMEGNEEKAEKSYQLGLKALEEQRNDEAIIHFKSAIQKNLSHANAHYQLGSLYAKSKQLVLAERELDMAIRYDPGLNEARRMLAMIYFRKQDYAKAIPLFKELIEKEGEDSGTLFYLGNSLVKVGNAEEAKKILQKAIEAYPDDANIRMSFAQSLILDGQIKEAR
jgi:tetratricopeptide (TPR) repeat protein